MAEPLTSVGSWSSLQSMEVAGRIEQVGEVLRRRYRLLLLLILGLGAALRVATYFDLEAIDPAFHHPGLDSLSFLRWGARIAAGEMGLDRPFFLNPLYPYFLAPILKIFGAHHLIAIRLIQGVLGLLTILATAGAARRFVGPITALGAALIIATYPLLLYYEQKVMIVTLAVFLNAMTLWLIARFMEKRTIGSAALAGIPLGLSVLARPNVAIFALLLPFWFLGFAPTGKRLRFVVVNTAIFFGAIAVMIFPVTLHNYLVGDDFVPVTSSMGCNVYQSNNPEAWRSDWMASAELRLNPVLIENDAEEVAEREMGRELKSSEISDYWLKRALRVMRENPSQAAHFLLRKGLYFFEGEEIPSSYNFPFDRSESVLLRLLPITFWWISPLMLLGSVAVLSTRRKAAPLVFLLLAYAVGLTLFFPLAHYRAPVLPAAIPLAVLGVGYLIEALRGGGSLRNRLILLTLFVLLSRAPTIARELGVPRFAEREPDYVVYHYNQGMFLLGEGQLNAAEAAFRKGIAFKPEAWFSYDGLAALSNARGEPANEARYLEKVLEIKRDSWDTLARLGRLHFNRGDVKEGLRLGRIAAERAPRDHNVQVELALMYLDLERFEEALHYFEQSEAGARNPLPEVVSDQSLCLRKLGRADEARARVKRALGMSPENSYLLIERAHIAVETGARDPEAIRRDLLKVRDAGGHIPEELRKWIE